MTSIITNTAAMAALSTLRSVSADMETTQGRVSSGYKVETASDNAAYWSIATTMRSDNKSLGAVEDALGLGAAKTDVTSTAMESSISVIDEIKAKLVAASEPGVDKSKIQKEITELQSQLVSVAKSASFSGENWVYHDDNNKFNTQKSSLISKTAGDYTDQQIDAADGATNDVSWLSAKMGYNDIADDGTATPTALDYSILTLDVSSMTTVDEVSAAISGVDFVLQKMTDAASDLGALNSRVTLQQDFVKDLSDSIEKGVGRLVDADMNEESTRLKALQTQQQLGIQSLSIANTSSQSVLSLFQG
ncbi:flagellin [Rhizobiales bacterium RZME27]|uniref:Flagellin n=1 Tax=Endobacterium cereale TaxID=2663029 RepID=A0A6A8AEA8_9HYPH|nr:flagellin [Endobacterium cereale]MQY48090.1 flagellin [Endobacterium cereale]